MILDGGLATTLQTRGLPPRTAVDDWVRDHPDEVAGAHRAFVAAGAKLTLTATFQTFPHLRPDWEAIADRAVTLASGAGGMVWGSIGPGAHPGEWAALAARLRPQITGLVLETFVSPAECVAAVREVRTVFPDLPVVASLVPREDGLLRDGGHPGPALTNLRRAGATLVGFNCASPAAVEAAVSGSFCEWAKPNRGELSREALVASLLRLAKKVPYVGGCCGVGPEDIAAFRDAS